ncbi:MAG: GreA/GreB family elongation factor [Motiliproteus sp.]
MNKAELIHLILEQLQLELDGALHASQQAHELATHSESKAENKYDTRGLEAAYLAHGLSQRAQELQQSIVDFRQLLPLAGAQSQNDPDHIQIGALVMLEDEDEKKRWFFLGPQAGGLKLQWQGRDITIISPTAPLGQALSGQQLDDEVRLTINGKHTQYLICEII